MGCNKITNIKNYDYNQKMRYLNDQHYNQACKDSDVIYKFCQVKEKAKTGNPGSTNDISDTDKEQRIDVLGGANPGSSTTANSNPVTPNQSKPVTAELVPPTAPSSGTSSILGQIAEQDAKMMGIAVKLK